MSANGSLWIFSGHFCYYSYLFGNETKVRLRLSEIAKITPSGSSSIEIITTKRNEQHKFVGFPSKDRRDAVVEYVTKFKQNMNKNKSPTYHQSVSAETHSLNDIKGIDTYKRSNSTKLSPRKHSNSIGEDSFYSPNAKSNDDIYKPTPPITPAPSKPIPSTSLNGNNDISPIGNGHSKESSLGSDSLNNIINDSHKNEEQSIISRKKSHGEPLSPAKFIGIHPSQQQQTIQSQQKRRRKSSGGINYNNPPTFRLQSIASQQSLHLITPNVDSSDDEKENKDKDGMDIKGNGLLKRQPSNKDAGGAAMDTLDILNLDKSLSIRNSSHSSSGESNRNRSLSDSDMPHHDDDSPQSTKSDASITTHHNHSKHHKKSKSKGSGWLSIFQFSYYVLLQIFSVRVDSKSCNLFKLVHSLKWRAIALEIEIKILVEYIGKILIQNRIKRNKLKHQHQWVVFLNKFMK